MSLVRMILGGLLFVVAFMILAISLFGIVKSPVAALIGIAVGVAITRYAYRMLPEDSDEVKRNPEIVRSDAQLDENEFSLTKLAVIDISKLSIVGWLFVLSTLAVMCVSAGFLLQRLPQHARDRRLPGQAVALIGLVIAGGYFWLGRMILKRLGFSMFQREAPKCEPEEWHERQD